MKNLAFACFSLLVAPCALMSADLGLDELQGKWSTKRTNDEGRVFSQSMEFAQDKMTFELRDENGDARFVAKAKVKTQKAGPLKAFTLFDIEGGRSESELQSVDDDRTSVYTLRDGKLIVASNFDRDRNRERPSIEVYTREAATRSPTSTPDTGAEKLLGTWEMELSIGDNAIDYSLLIEKGADGQLAATLISPRSGKHKFKSIEYKDGQLKMEIDREIEGQETTLLYTGKLTGGKLSGKVSAKGLGDGAATWQATK